MSRSGYSDECDGWALIRWRGAVTSAIRGERGQAALREIAAALDALPAQSLISEELVDANGEVCALGALGKARGMDLTAVDYEDRKAVAKAFDISESLAAEIMFENDESVDGWQWVPFDRIPRRRWEHMRAWVQQQIKESP